MSERSASAKPKIWVGKAGLTDQFITQLKKQLKVDKLVKVKVQKSFASVHEMNEITGAAAAATGAYVIDIRGRTFTLYRERDDVSETP
ncbi:MAG: YhbY family RNA-binding protein [Candidatus Bathyarchaeia archaeon]|nr:YhbY family RNA-binding protein [Candidatus Bathyarchaeota archaeon]